MNIPHVYNPLFYFSIIAFLLIFVSSPFFKLADASWHNSTTRTINLDGLRGILAISVFIQHSAWLQHSIMGIPWGVPIPSIYIQAGEASVSLFFMITGFLFWRKAILAKGRIDWMRLYINRFFRIAPIFYLSISIVLFVVFYKSNFQLRETTSILFNEISPLLLAGFYKIGHLINGYPLPGEINANVTWTLRYEWEFYLLILPISAFFARRVGWHLLFTGAGFLLLVMVTIKSPQSHVAIALLEFFGGMLCASIQQYFLFEVREGVSNIVSSIILTGLLITLMHFSTAYSTVPFLILWCVFLLITLGCSFFGLLSSKPARRLGELSYSIYLLHGIVLYGFFKYQGVLNFARSTAMNFWLSIAIAGAIAVSITMVSHLLIEIRGIRIGKRLSQSIRWSNLKLNRPGFRGG